MTVTVRIDEATEVKLRRLLEQQGSSLSAFVRVPSIAVDAGP